MWQGCLESLFSKAKEGMHLPVLQALSRSGVDAIFVIQVTTRPALPYPQTSTLNSVHCLAILTNSKLKSLLSNFNPQSSISLLCRIPILLLRLLPGGSACWTSGMPQLSPSPSSPLALFCPWISIACRVVQVEVPRCYHALGRTRLRLLSTSL